jgi:hypothetical protein
MRWIWLVFGGVLAGCSGESSDLAQDSDAEITDSDQPVDTDQPADTDTDTTDTDCSTVWYRDADGDGYGNGFDHVTACDRPPGYVADETDCNDTVAHAHPGGTEVCDEANVDEDCDGDSDDMDGSTEATGMVIWYQDYDDDGYGTDREDIDTELACDEPLGSWSTNNLDCAYTWPDRNPGAPEVCDYYGTDEDCDGEGNEGC